MKGGLNHRKSVVYVIENTKNKKKYFGVTSDYKRRKNEHFYNLRNNRHNNTTLQSEYNQYGEKHFKIYVIQTTNNRSEAFGIESELIKKYQTTKNQYGYNMKGGDTVWNKKINFSTTLEPEVGECILKQIKKLEMTASEWVREAIIDKAKKDGLL